MSQLDAQDRERILVFDHILAGGDFLKSAAYSADDYVRTVLKEDGLTRQMFTAFKITADDLDLSVSSDKPMKIVEKEVDTVATSLPYRDSAPTEYITGDRYAISFHKISTEKLMKNIVELKSQKNDVRKILTDNGLKEIETEEDSTLFGQFDTICAAAPTTQLHAPAGGLTRKNLIDGIIKFQKLKVLPGYMVMNNNTYMTYIKNLEATDVDGGLTSDVMTGEKKLTHIYEWPLLISIKDDIVLDNIVYLVAKEDYLGKFFVLTEPTSHMKVEEGDTLIWFFWEVIGLGIGNTAAVVKCDFTA